jgi:hypothetical protein
MPRLDDSLELQAPSRSALTPGRPADDALLRLLAHMAYSDGIVHDDELEFLARVRPGLNPDQLRDWALKHGGAELDLDSVVSALETPDEQWKCLRYAARMAWKDAELADEERELLARLARGMKLPDGAVSRVLDEMAPDDGKRFAEARILKCLMEIHWDAVQLASGDLVSEDLLAVTPHSTGVVARIGLESVEVMAVCTGGISGRFLEGAAFLSWSDIVTYTRTFELGSAVRLHTETGASYCLVDGRLTGLAVFLDRLLGADERRGRGDKPKVVHSRGE